MRTEREIIACGSRLKRDAAYNSKSSTTRDASHHREADMHTCGVAPRSSTKLENDSKLDLKIIACGRCGAPIVFSARMLRIHPTSKMITARTAPATSRVELAGGLQPPCAS